MVIQFDATAGVYELFTEEGDWLGAYDTFQEALDARAKWRSYGE